MPKGFKRTKNCYNQQRRDLRKRTRMFVNDDLKRELECEIRLSHVKGPPTRWTIFGTFGGMSSGNSFASHRKFTTRQKELLKCNSE